MKKESLIYVAGHEGFMGSAFVRFLKKQGYLNLLLKFKKELNLLEKKEVEDFFKKERPEYVFLAEEISGGILANTTYPADFIRENLTIQINVIDVAFKNKVKKLLFLGSSCAYPKVCKQPMKEELLLTGRPEVTSEPYAIAKIAGIKMCQAYNEQYATNFISVIPANLYGQGDNFDLKNSHVLQALIRKFHEAKLSNEKTVFIWGSGKPKREFLNIDDFAGACIFLMNTYDKNEPINIGTGKDISIKELAIVIKKAVGFKGKIIFDKTKPDGMPRKLLDTSKINKLGWKAKIDLKTGILETYKYFKSKK